MQGQLLEPVYSYFWMWRKGYKIQSKVDGYRHCSCGIRPHGITRHAHSSQAEKCKGNTTCVIREHGQLRAESVIPRSSQHHLTGKPPAFTRGCSLWESWDMRGCWWRDEQMLFIPCASGSTFFIMSEWVCGASESCCDCLARWGVFKLSLSSLSFVIRSVH